MIFIGGVQPKTVKLEKYPQACPSCAHADVYLKRVDHYISLFFIPILRIKKGESFLGCNHCGALLEQGGSTTSWGNPGKGRQCGYCGKVVEADFAYCPYCGSPRRGAGQ